VLAGGKQEDDPVNSESLICARESGRGGSQQ
jgi:hypothetical protein